MDANFLADLKAALKAETHPSGQLLRFLDRSFSHAAEHPEEFQALPVPWDESPWAEHLVMTLSNGMISGDFRKDLDAKVLVGSLIGAIMANLPRASDPLTAATLYRWSMHGLAAPPRPLR